MTSPTPPRTILYSDMGADPRRTRLAEELNEALLPHGCEIFGLFLHPRRTTVPYFLIPRLVRPMNDPRFRFMGRLSDSQLSGDVAAAARIQEGITPRYRWPDLAGRFWLFKQIIAEQLEDIKPDLVLMWHQFNPFHTILAAEARARGIPVAYGEHGVLPGSMCIEAEGQMAESWVARDPAGFRALPASDDDLVRARAMIAHVKTQRINRKAPGARLGNHVTLPARGAEGRVPVVFYAGQNDPRAGLFPIASAAARQHSPFYDTSFDALTHLAEVCGRNGWTLLYKPHPQVSEYEKARNKLDFAANPHVVRVPIEVDVIDCIEAADVCTTVVSQTAYMALFNDRASLVMGRLQLNGSGAVYELNTREDLEPVLVRAIADGLTGDQRQAFEHHVARAARHYCARFDAAMDGYLPNDLAVSAERLAGLAQDRQPGGCLIGTSS